MDADLPTPPLRADARRNRDALVTAARKVFGELGLDAPLDAIAREAGVGRATLYRRFPTRDDLITAIFQANIDALEEIWHAAEDRSRAFFEVFGAAIAMQNENLGFTELFTRRPLAEEFRVQVEERFNAILEPAVKAAQDGGHLRPDVTVVDVGTVLLMIGTATANFRLHPGTEPQRRRTINLLFDALVPDRAPRALDEPTPEFAGGAGAGPEPAG